MALVVFSILISTVTLYALCISYSQRNHHLQIRGRCRKQDITCALHEGSWRKAGPKHARARRKMLARSVSQTLETNGRQSCRCLYKNDTVRKSRGFSQRWRYDIRSSDQSSRPRGSTNSRRCEFRNYVVFSTICNDYKPGMIFFFHKQNNALGECDPRKYAMTSIEFFLLTSSRNPNTAFIYYWLVIIWPDPIL